MVEFIEIPKVCPICGQPTSVKISTIKNAKGEVIQETKTLVCENHDCAAKKIYSMEHFASRDCMKIVDMSEARITELVETHFLHDISDFYRLAKKYDEIGDIVSDFGEHLSTREGWGAKSVENIVKSIKASQTTNFITFITACGIPNIGRGQAKVLKKHLDTIYSEKETDFNNQTDGDGSYDLLGFLAWLVANDYDFTTIEGWGEKLATSLIEWVNEYLSDPNDDNEIIRTLSYLRFTDRPIDFNALSSSSMDGVTFVITGSLNGYENRKELQKIIEDRGGKVAGSVSSKTNYLINNDNTSGSTKNKQAHALGIPIITEEEFNKKFLQ